MPLAGRRFERLYGAYAIDQEALYPSRPITGLLSLNATQGNYKIRGIYVPFTCLERARMEVDGDERKFFFYGSRNIFEANRNSNHGVEELFQRHDPHGKGACVEIPFAETLMMGSRLDMLRYMIDEASGSVGEKLMAGLEDVSDIRQLKLPAWFKDIGEASGGISSSRHKENTSQRIRVKKPSFFVSPMTGRSRKNAV